MTPEREELDRIIVSKVNEGEVHDAAGAILDAGYRKTGNPIMTPTEAEHLRDLFYAARQTTRDAVLGRPEAYAADDAATEAFNAALREYTKEGAQ